jgi:hypothetical protein
VLSVLIAEQELPEGEEKAALLAQSVRLVEIYDELAAQYHGDKSANEGRLAHA